MDLYNHSVLITVSSPRRHNKSLGFTLHWRLLPAQVDRNPAALIKACYDYGSSLHHRAGNGPVKWQRVNLSSVCPGSEQMTDMQFCETATRLRTAQLMDLFLNPVHMNISTVFCFFVWFSNDKTKRRKRWCLMFNIGSATPGGPKKHQKTCNKNRTLWKCVLFKKLLNEKQPSTFTQGPRPVSIHLLRWPRSLSLSVCL